MIYVFLTGKQEQDRYLKQVAIGIGGKLVYTKQFLSIIEKRPGMPRKVKAKKLYDATGLVFAGILRGNYHILKSALANNIPFYYIDHAYFNAGYGKPHWMRITKNGFCQNQILPNADSERFNSNFSSVGFDNYNFKQKKNILVLPPSNSTARVFGDTNWETIITKKIKQYTDRPIVVRRKNGPIMDDMMLLQKDKEKYIYDETLEEALNKAYCVVAYNSSVALTALQRGIPVICERFCPAYPLSHDISEIENLIEKDRFPLFSSLAHGQYKMKEAADPRTFRFINSSTQWKGSLK